MRDRLIELIKRAEIDFANTGRPVLDIEEYVADHLLAEGVIVPPVQVGGSIYICRGNKIKEYIVQKIELLKESIYFAFDWHGMGYEWVSKSDFGKTVFLTRDEAEKALEEEQK